MRMSAALAGAVTLAVILAPAADAAPKKKAPPPPPVCNLVKDVAGDSTNDFNGLPVWPADNGLDIVGADVASGAKQITAVIRLAAEPGTPSDLYLKRYITQFTVAGQKFPMVMAVGISPSGTTYSFGWNEVDAAGRSSYKYSATPAAGRVDGKTISVTANLADIAGEANLGAIKRGAKISAFVVTANRRVPSNAGVTGVVYPADEATSSKAYAAGARSCVKVS